MIKTDASIIYNRITLSTSKSEQHSTILHIISYETVARLKLGKSHHRKEYNQSSITAKNVILNRTRYNDVIHGKCINVQKTSKGSRRSQTKYAVKEVTNYIRISNKLKRIKTISQAC